MPYTIKNNSVVKKDSGEVVGHSDNPKQYLKVLNAIEHGWVPSGASMKTLPSKKKLKKKIINK